jgi:hypothetical protein
LRESLIPGKIQRASPAVAGEIAKGGPMARLEISIKHGQPPEVARAKFQSGVREAHARFSGWIQSLEWSDDGRSATFTGSGFEVRCWYDDSDLHIQGSVPFAWKLLEGMIRGQIKHHIDRSLTTHHK